MDKKDLAVIGSGATAIYLLKHLSDSITVFQQEIGSITIFEKSGTLGMGMPYNPNTTDMYNLANISSEEIPELPETFGDWLRRQDEDLLNALNIKNLPIDDTQVYSRVALGSYLSEQYSKLIASLKKSGIEFVEMQNTEVIDIKQMQNNLTVSVELNSGESLNFSKVVIATGHTWKASDRPECGYFASPWPIYKILPKKNAFYNFTIGTLGASLSAFDVVTSLAHRHGKFMKDVKGLHYEKSGDAPKFKMVMHSAEGWLPHLQYEQKRPKREIYRHTDRDEMLSLIDSEGFIGIESYYDSICRPALIDALNKDGEKSLAIKTANSQNSFKDFVKLMSEQHEYTDSFDGMRKEMVEAKNSVENNYPIHWKETLDDLMYCLNFHTELMPAEDHQFFKMKVMPFLMNVISALPLSSANILLALNEAGCIDIVAGKASISDTNKAGEKTKLEVEHKDGSTELLEYEMFIDCAGQKNLELEEYPFRSLVKSRSVRKARAEFKSVVSAEKFQKDSEIKQVKSEGSSNYLYTGGIDIDAAYRIIGEHGKANDNIYDITFTHTSGHRSYSYGLQACNATSKILVESWKSALGKNSGIKVGIQDVSRIYEEENDL